MTEATHLNLDKDRLKESSRKHSLRAARELKKLVQDEWPSNGTEEMTERVFNLDGKLIETAVYVRRYLDVIGVKKATENDHSDPSNPFIVDFSQPTNKRDLRLAVNKIIHHEMMHAENPGCPEIKTITCECDKREFTKIDIVRFCDAVETALCDEHIQ